MRTKLFRLLLVFLTMVMLLALGLNVYAAQSNAVTQDGITAQLFTDKDSYKSGESVQATVQVNNQTGSEVFVFAQIGVPDGVKLAGETNAFDGCLQDGESLKIAGGKLELSQITATTANASAGSSTATGDNMQAGLWVMMTALMVIGLIALFVYGKNRKTWLSVLLCMVLLGGLCAGYVPVQAADMNGDIQLSCTIQVDGKAAEVTATVSYVIYVDAEEAAADNAGSDDATDSSEATDSSDATDSSESTGDDNTDSSEGTGDDNTDSSEDSGDDNTDSDAAEDTVVEGYKVVAVSAIGDDGNKPENTYDGSYDTRWSYEGRGAWIIWELEEVQELGYMGISFYCGDERMSSFDILTSTDGVNWTETAVSVKSDMTTGMMAVDLNGAEAKYIKFVGYGNTSNQWNSVEEVGFYPETESGEMILPEVTESSTDVTTLPQDIQDALAELLAIFNDDVVDFLANLYDPITGGFYCSNSARDYEGFEPNLESTKQIFAALDQWTAPGTNVQDDYLPEGYGEKLADWVYGLQDISEGYEPYKGDGYFYHPQWGKDITDQKRNRDLSWAIQLLARFDREPMEPTAIDRIQADAGAAVALAAETNSSLPAYAQSKEAMIAWLEGLNWDNQYYAANQVNAALGTLRAAGLTDEAAEWLSTIQNQETGLWGDDLSYNSLNATMKVAPIFTDAGMVIPNVDKAVDSIIEAQLTLTPTIASEPYNAWNVLVSIRQQIVKVDGDLAAFEEKLYAKAPDMIRKTIESIELFRIPEEGGFCYDYRSQSGTQQDAPASLPIVEAGVNGTLLLVNGAVSSTYQALGLKIESPYDHDDLVRFMEIIQTVKAPEKLPINAQSFFDFEDGELSTSIIPTLVEGSLAIETAATDANSANKALAFTSAKGSGDKTRINLPDSEKGEPLTIDFDILPSGITKNQTVAVSLISNGSYAYQLMFTGTADGADTVYVGDRRYGSGTAEFKQSQTFTDENGAVRTYDKTKWHHVKVVYTPPTEDTEVNIRVYVDDVLVQNCAKFYFTDAEGNGTAKAYINGLHLWAFSDMWGTIYIDNIMMTEGAYEDPNLCEHSMTLTDAVAATCEANGHTAYYTCSKCSRYFSDEAGTEVIADLQDTVIQGGHIYDHLLDADCNREGCTHTRTAGQTTLDFEGETMETLKNTGDTAIVEGKDASNEPFKSVISASNMTVTDSTVELATIEKDADTDNKAVAFNTKDGSGEQMDIALPLSKSMEDVTVEFKLKLGGELAAQKLGIALTNTEEATTLNNVNVMANLLVLLPSEDLTTFKVYAHNSLGSDVKAENVFTDEQGNALTYTCGEWHTFKLIYSPSDEKISVYIDEALVKEYTPTLFGAANKTFFAYGSGKEKYRDSIYTAINGIRMVSYRTGAGTMYMDDIKITQQAAEDACEHQLTAHEAVAATCEADGNIAYWTCDTCGKYYSDAEANNQIIEADTKINALEHAYTDDFDMTCNNAGCSETRSVTITFTEESIENSERFKATYLTGTKGAWSVASDDAKGSVLKFETFAHSTDGSELKILLPTSTENEPVAIEYNVKMVASTVSERLEFRLYSNGINSSETTEQEYQIYTYFSVADTETGVYSKTNWKDRNWTSNKTGYRSEAFTDGDGNNFTSTNDEWHKVKIVYTPPKGEQTVNIKVYVDDVLVRDSDNSYMKKSGNSYVVQPGASINCFSIKASPAMAAEVYVDQITVSMVDAATE